MSDRCGDTKEFCLPGSLCLQVICELWDDHAGRHEVAVPSGKWAQYNDRPGLVFSWEQT